jgi:hypothetical protein
MLRVLKVARSSLATLSYLPTIWQPHGALAGQFVLQLSHAHQQNRGR